MKIAKLFISLYTDQDWCFRSKDGLIDYAEYFDGDARYHFAFETLHPSDGRFYVSNLLSTDEYERNLKSSDGHSVPYLTAEEFLTQLKEDLHYGDSHEWIREEFDAMADGAIEFIKKGNPGVYYGSLEDGNWQPSGLFVVIEKEKTEDE